MGEALQAGKQGLGEKQGLPQGFAGLGHSWWVDWRGRPATPEVGPNSARALCKEWDAATLPTRGHSLAGAGH